MSKIKLATCVERLVEISFSCLAPHQLPLFLLCSLVLYWFAVLWVDAETWLFFIVFVPCCSISISGKKRFFFFMSLPVLTNCCGSVPCGLLLNCLWGWLGQSGKHAASGNNLCWNLSRWSGIGLAGHSARGFAGWGGGELTADLSGCWQVPTLAIC